MLARLITVALLSVASAAIPRAADAQPYGWFTDYSGFPLGPGYRQWIAVVNLANGADVARFDVPTEVTLGRGDLTPDGRYYLRASSIGIARFHANPPAFDRMIGPPAAVTAVYVAPIGTAVHAVGDFGRAVVDWQTGAVLGVQCCAAPQVFFTPDGAVRLDITHTTPTGGDALMTAYRSASGQQLWSVTLADARRFSLPGGALVSVSNAHVAVQTGAFDNSQLVIRDVGTGGELARIASWAEGLAWRGDTLIVSKYGPPFQNNPTPRLSAYPPPYDHEVVILDEPSDSILWTFPLDVTVSSDGRHAYWQRLKSVMGGPDPVLYEVVDLAASAVVTTGRLGRVSDLVLERTTQCLFSVPPVLAAPAMGAIVRIPVTPGAGCRPWTLTSTSLPVLNPGPHNGPATILVQVPPQSGASPLSHYIVVGATVRIEQAPGLPGGPDLAGAVSGDRVVLTWTPDVGAGITSFVARMRQRGTASVSTVTLGSAARTWTSPVLAPGSYDFEVVAMNGAGAGPLSNPVSLSIGVQTLPEAPAGLSAEVRDDMVRLAWLASPSGPAPAGFVVEAAAAGSAVFTGVVSTTAPSLVATRVPAGTWQVRVRAATAGGVGPPSSTVLIQPRPCTAPPGAPQWTWAYVAHAASGNVVTGRWAPPATGAVEEYVLQWSATSGGREYQLVVPGSQISHTQTLPPGTWVYVRVGARNACGQGAPSGEIIVSSY